MLTSAVRPYAEAMNTTFRLGFGPCDIVSRETLGKHSNVDPAGILVDNGPEVPAADDWDAYKGRQLKLYHIGSRAVVEVPFFRGEACDEFDATWKTYVEEVVALKEGRPKRAQVVAPLPDGPQVKPMDLLRSLERAARRKRRR